MMRKSVIGFALFLTFRLASAQDFQKTYDLPPEGEILIDSYLGNVKVAGYSGRGVVIKAYKKGADRDSIQIVDMSFGNRVQLMTRYPQPYTGTSTVDFEVQVPNSTKYNFSRLASFGGSVTISDVEGQLRAESFKGSVALKDVRGVVSARSISGDLNVELDRGRGPGVMMLSSVSGNIDVSAPADLQARINMSSTSGTLRTDFPIEVQEHRYGPGRSAWGILGSGKQVLRMSSVSGRVSLTQK